MRKYHSNAKIVVVLLLFISVSATMQEDDRLPEKLHREIWTYKNVVDQIIAHTVHGAAKHRTYTRLANLTDSFGARMTGTQALEDSIDFVLEEWKNAGLDKVYAEPVQLPLWKRVNETARLLSPVYRDLYILGLGNTVPTPPEGIQAEAIVVRSWDELQQRQNEIQGKIVVYNQAWKGEGVLGYMSSVLYRGKGAYEAARVGAVATLIRSVTPFSVYSPHTGGQLYGEGVPQIPAASITVEDAEMLYRLQQRGQKIVIDLRIESHTDGNYTSRNVVGEIQGSKYQDQYVVIGGHIDSWDVGTGAMDDGGGVVISWEAMVVLRDLGLVPRRTLRTVLWTAEEQGLIGGNTYYEMHKDLIPKISLIMESDSGTFRPKGIDFSGSRLARAIIREILAMTTAINTTEVGPSGLSPDTRWWMLSGVPSGSLRNDNRDYFIYHHSHGDRLTVEDPDILDLCTAVWTCVSYVVADLQDLLPRENTFRSHGLPALLNSNLPLLTSGMVTALLALHI